jgi:carboxymethylenebutenolidase
MGETVQLTSADGHQFDAYRAAPDGVPLGAVVVIQEIFGVNKHIRDVTEGFAREGYLAIAPAIFDRFSKGVELGYEEDDISIGRELKSKGNENLDNILADVEAAFDAVKDNGFVGITGYCWGGVIVWAAACRLNFDAASSYYGGGIIDLVNESPKCKTIMHFGREDESIPLEDVNIISTAHPKVIVHLYNAGHGFNCDRRRSYDEKSAELALIRTLKLFTGAIN